MYKILTTIYITLLPLCIKHNDNIQPTILLYTDGKLRFYVIIRNYYRNVKGQCYAVSRSI